MSVGSGVLQPVEGPRIPGLGRDLVGTTLAGPDRLLLTLSSQIIILDTEGGTRVREWSFRPDPATALTVPAVICCERWVVAVQGSRLIVAWPDKAPSPSATVGTVEGLISEEVGFDVISLAAAGSIIWCAGSKQAVAFCLRAASVGSRPGVTTIPRMGPVVKGEAGPRKGNFIAMTIAGPAEFDSDLLSCVCTESHPATLLVGTARGTVHLLKATPSEHDTVAIAPQRCCGQDAPLAAGSAHLEVPEGLTEAKLRACGFVPGGFGSRRDDDGASDGPLVWSVWEGQEGQAQWSVARVAAGIVDGEAVTVQELFARPLEGPVETTGKARSKRKRSGDCSNKQAAGRVVLPFVVGFEDAQQIAMVGAGGSLSVWDAIHGLCLGVGPSPFEGLHPLVARQGLIACQIGGDVLIWRVESQGDGEDGPPGLRQLLGLGLKRARVSGVPSSLNGTSSVSVAPTLVFVGEKGWSEQEEHGGNPGGAEEEVQQLLHELEKVASGTSKMSDMAEEKKKAYVVKNVLKHERLRRVSPSAVDAVIERCLEGSEEKSSLWWLLFECLVQRGKVSVRRHPQLLEQLMARHETAMVRKVLSGPGVVPERAMVLVLVKCIRRADGARTKSSTVQLRHLLAILSACVRRPACPAFLRAALAELDRPSAATLLLLLNSLLCRAMLRPVATRHRTVDAQDVLVWAEALLDANLVNMVVEGSSSSVVASALQSIKEASTTTIKACEALEGLAGYVEQIRKAGHCVQVVPDYSVDIIRV